MHAHIVAIYGSLLALLFIFLSYRVVKFRRRDRVDIGAGDSQPLGRAVRAHANFTEYVPLALILLLVLEQTAFAHWALHLLGGLLFIGRCLHGWGFVSRVGPSFGRVWGTALTWGVIITAAMGNLYYVVMSALY